MRSPPHFSFHVLIEFDDCDTHRFARAKACDSEIRPAIFGGPPVDLHRAGAIALQVRSGPSPFGQVYQGVSAASPPSQRGARYRRRKLTGATTLGWHAELIAGGSGKVRRDTEIPLGRLRRNVPLPARHRTEARRGNLRRARCGVLVRVWVGRACLLRAIPAQIVRLTLWARRNSPR